MRAVVATAVVNAEHQMMVTLPPDIPPGVRSVVIVLDDSAMTLARKGPLHLTPHPVGTSDPSMTYRREDIYGDDGR